MSAAESKTYFLATSGGPISQSFAAQVLENGDRLLLWETQKGVLGLDTSKSVIRAAGVSQVAGLLVKGKQKFGHVHGFVNDVDSKPVLGSYLSRTAAMSPMLELNRQQIARFLATGIGAIVNIAGSFGSVADHLDSLYNAKISETAGLTSALAKEFGRNKVGLNAIRPGVMRGDHWSEVEDDSLIRQSNSSWTFVEPDSICRAIWWLLQEDCPVNGQVITVD